MINNFAERDLNPSFLRRIGEMGVWALPWYILWHLAFAQAWLIFPLTLSGATEPGQLAKAPTDAVQVGKADIANEDVDNRVEV